jgi:hypothetical protein
MIRCTVIGQMRTGSAGHQSREHQDRNLPGAAIGLAKAQHGAALELRHIEVRARSPHVAMAPTSSDYRAQRPSGGGLAGSTRVLDLGRQSSDSGAHVERTRADGSQPEIKKDQVSGIATRSCKWIRKPMLYPLSYEGARHQGACLRRPAVPWAYQPSPPVVVRHAADRGTHGDPTGMSMILVWAPVSTYCHP